jgi:hypothetical protein
MVFQLVVEPYPPEKYDFVNGKDDIPYIMENKKCSKPPTSILPKYGDSICSKLPRSRCAPAQDLAAARRGGRLRKKNAGIAGKNHGTRGNLASFLYIYMRDI